jgi:hypothetical protein
MSSSTPRLRFSDRVPPLDEALARRLRGLPASWEDRVVETDVAALVTRGKRIVAALDAAGRTEEAARLDRTVADLERVDKLHFHAFRVETLTQLYCALVTLLGPVADDLWPEDAPTLTQSGALADAADEAAHGPAYRATRALRNRAARQLAWAMARATREARDQGGGGAKRRSGSPGNGRADARSARSRSHASG